ncbi:MAG: AAA family ATPase [Candidatus Aminicenantes bacterium]|nr:AAA family ATPase [Candidatus Aminicenantes bacterium]NIM77753.1 AAA family ATPase [Candidatus Aminicenantes bacterium]NIN17066.1 AAA family ATPase [Candidatus Aminicenantes bacterium]NIN40959.1 AAA family ATPase [Candidatus Aminicenantes bacterium]NIN83764.1 AAA family ATPase [Candidatus Aminicenantes bacterium]
MTISESAKTKAGPTTKPFTIVVLGRESSGKSTLITALCYYIIKQKEEFLLQMNLDKNDTRMLSGWVYGFENTSIPLSDSRLRHEFDFNITSSIKKVKHDLKVIEIILPGVNQIDSGTQKYSDDLRGADLILLTIDSRNVEKDDVYFSLFFETLFSSIDNPAPMIFILTKYDLIKPELKQQPEGGNSLSSLMPATFKRLKYSNYKMPEYLNFSIGDINKDGLSFDRSKVESFDIGYCEELFTTIYSYLNNQETSLKDKKRSQLESVLKNLQKRLNSEPENPEILLEMKSIYEQLGEQGKAKTVDDTLEQLEERKEFQYNLNNPVSLQQLELSQLDFFGDSCWRFQPQLNVLLGKNGYGKTHLLRLLAALLQKDEEKIAEFFEYSKTDPFTRLVVERNEEYKLIRRNKIIFEESIGKIPFLALPDLRLMDKSKTAVSTSDDEKTDLKEYGAYHFLYQKPYEGLIRTFLYQLCITYLDSGKTFDLPIFRMIHKIIEKLSEQPFAFHKITPVGQARFKIEVITEGNENPIPIQHASQGTLSILAIAGLVYSYLKAIFPTVPEEKLSQQRAIVLIDELDAHLHPVWQQKITGLLRENFPNIQFMVTAHSPLVVAGCREGEVSVLKKGKDGFVIEQFDHDFIGYQARELYEKIFEIEDKDLTYLYYTALYPFKGEIEAEINRLDEKKKSQPLTIEEKKKLSRLYDDLYYTNRANEMFEKRLEYTSVLRENKRLKSKIKQLQQESGKRHHGSK